MTNAVQVNLIETYLCWRALHPVTLRQNHGNIINRARTGTTNASENLSTYGLTKFALVRITVTMSVELSDKNIKVNALGPEATRARIWEKMPDLAHESRWHRPRGTRFASNQRKWRCCLPVLPR